MAKAAVNDIDRQIGLRLKKRRQQIGVSAASLAEAIGSTQQQISRYENGQNKLSAAQLYLLSQSLRVPISWFFLDCTPELVPLQISEPTPVYIRNIINEELITLQNIWPQLTASQRSSLLKLLDSFLG